ncbi:unnamed protein product [Blepharisma stoltei]|uniref:CBM20 domain-containing protein n=1 Tax=Blepharisma stoltei TaxID=1481888 RepID=A0AAU9I8N6_9CILI|nr:unnamed protein product [Blepharisma stoltei]
MAPKEITHFTKFRTDTQKFKKRKPAITNESSINIPCRKKYKENQSFEIIFSIWYDTWPGERIFITGGYDFLGEWNICKAIEMAWFEGNEWRAGLHLIANKFPTFEYKYAVVSSDGVRWEEGPFHHITHPEGNEDDGRVLITRNDFWHL